MANQRGPLNSADPTTSILVGGVYNAVAPTPADQQPCALQLDSEGNLLVNVIAGGGGGSNASVGLTGNAAPTSATEIGVVDNSGKLQNLTGLILTNAHAATVAIVDGSGNQITSFGGGTQYSDGITQATPTGTVALGKNPSNVLHALSLDASGNLNVNLNANSFGIVSVSGTVTANQGGAPWSVTFPSAQAVTLPAGQAVELLDSAGVNKASISAAGALKVDGSAVTQPVSIAATVNVSVQNATLAVTQSTSPWVTSDNHLPASAVLADNLSNPTTTEIGANLLGWDATNTVWRRVQVDAGTGVLKVDASGSTQPVSGTVTANQGTAAVLSGAWPVEITDGSNVLGTSSHPLRIDPTGTTVQPVSGTVVVTQGASPWVTQDTADAAITSSVGAASGFATGVGGLYNTTPPAPTNGQQVEFQTDQAGNLLSFPGGSVKAGPVWNSSTAQGTVQYPTGTGTVGAPLSVPAVVVTLPSTAPSFSSGAITFEGTYDGATWITIPSSQILGSKLGNNPIINNPLSVTFFNTNTNQPFIVLMQGMQNIRLKLSTAFVGSGSIASFWNVVPVAPSTISTNFSLGQFAANNATSMYVDGSYSYPGVPVMGSAGSEAFASWTNATAQNTALTQGLQAGRGTGLYTNILVLLNQVGTFSGGVLTFEVSDLLSGIWYPIQGIQADNSIVDSIYALQSNVNKAIHFNVPGAYYFRIRLSTVITGSGTANVNIQNAGLPGGVYSNPSVTQNGVWNVNQSIGVAGFEKITDGTNVAAVKAASTPAVMTDPALVVSLSPNSPAFVASLPLPSNAAQETGGNLATISSNSTLTVTNLVSEVDRGNRILLTLESMRRAMVALVCEGGKNKPTDFDLSVISKESGGLDADALGGI